MRLEGFLSGKMLGSQWAQRQSHGSGRPSEEGFHKPMLVRAGTHCSSLGSSEVLLGVLMLTAWLFFYIWIKLSVLGITQQAKKWLRSWTCAYQVDLALLCTISISPPSRPTVSYLSLCFFHSFFGLLSPLPFLSFLPLFFPLFFSHFIVFLAFRIRLGEKLTVSIVGVVFLALSRTGLKERSFLVSGKNCIPCDRIWNSLPVLVSVLLILLLQSKWIHYFLSNCFYGYNMNNKTVKKVFMQGL